MKLSIYSPEKVLFSSTEVLEVKVPGGKSSFSILPHHAPILSTLEKGKIEVLTSSKERKEWEISSGILFLQGEEIEIYLEK